MIITLLFASILSMASTDKTQTQLLADTGIPADVLLSETEKSLESYLFTDENGMSCGLQEFNMELFTASGNPNDNYTSFVVASNVLGPVGQTCGSYDEYMCYTTWIKTDSTWSVLGTECDEDTVYGE